MDSGPKFYVDVQPIGLNPDFEHIQTKIDFKSLNLNVPLSNEISMERGKESEYKNYDFSIKEGRERKSNGFIISSARKLKK
jgi:hypothetical protein